MTTIRTYEPSDWPAVWAIIEPVFRAGETYPYSPDISEEEARGKGLASRLCVHSQQEAVKLGFVSMQYNLVASTNAKAIHVWTKNGMKIVGTLPKAFRDPRRGLVDAFVMYRQLEGLPGREAANETT